jgi:hypothetical protein
VDNVGSDITLSEIFFEVGIGDVVVSAGIPMLKSHGDARERDRWCGRRIWRC